MLLNILNMTFIILFYLLNVTSLHPSILWISYNTMELRLGDNSTVTINLLPVTSNIPGVTAYCLFSGKIHGDLSSVVTVLGCIEDQETTLSIASSYLPDGVLHMVIVNGTSTILDFEADIYHDFNDALVPSSNRKKRSLTENTFDITLTTPQPKRMMTGSFYEGDLPEVVDLETTIWYDNSLLGKFDNDDDLTKQWLSIVVEFAKPLLLHPSLDIGINLKILGAEHANMTLEASVENAVKLQALQNDHLNSYFCYDLGSGTVGIAYVGAACSKYGYAVNINEYFTDLNSEITSARVFVHELGHNIGMFHDFDQIHGGYKNPCNGEGLMSYGVLANGPDKWSTCSNDDFISWFRLEGYECMSSSDFEPRDGGWGSWSPWSSCGSDCRRSKSRDCNNPTPAHGGADCVGASAYFYTCTGDSCEDIRVDGRWSCWTASSTCGSDCTRSRTRTCTEPSPSNGGLPCRGPNMTYSSCLGDDCPQVDGKWSCWSPYSTCGKDCLMSKKRFCNNPSPTGGGSGCKGYNEYFRQCSDCEDAGVWGSWTSWSSCGQDCQRTRSRSCFSPDGEDAYPATKCKGQGAYSYPCFEHECSDPMPDKRGTWGSWSSWTSCGTNCLKNRSRTCYGGFCLGFNTYSLPCFGDECTVALPLDGTWGSWSVWTKCGSDCLKSKTRSCNNPSPAYGGQGCSGYRTISTLCSVGDCPISGHWSQWSSWSACDSSCLTSRTRSCNGFGCQGVPELFRACNGGDCTSKPKWLTWSSWTTCGEDCRRSKSRVCDGDYCSGKTKYTFACTGGDCMTDGP